ncbi:hypothetical protein ACB098_01G045400 [Castanea mollissima]|uniref:Uncharacterized protein n=1 Tax=Castanea mollissima TaxID=60419 RepID=A0A8J4VT97_9ROSI|nr:hypothetical protein CMV_004887 [Castanea mollissima]
MGKKKPQKTKELSVAIAEASITGDEGQQQPLSQTPRKRGRPRKIIPESQDKKEDEEESVAKEAEDTTNESQSKKVKTGEEEEEEQQQKLKGEGSSASMGLGASKKEEGQAGKREVLPKEPPRSRARRKSKPRKSS